MQRHLLKGHRTKCVIFLVCGQWVGINSVCMCITCVSSTNQSF